MTSPENIRVSNPSAYESCDPDYLRQLREASGADETWLARTACLSVAQVRQLEEGGDSLFYSPTIKRQAYKRLLMILGAEPPSVLVDARPAPIAPAVNDLNEIIAMGERNLDHRPVSEFFQRWRTRVTQHRLSAAAVVVFCVAGVASFVLPKSGAEKASATELVMTKASESVTVSAPPAPVSVAPAVAASVAPALVPVVSASAVASAAPVVVASSCQHTRDALPQLVPLTATKPSRYVHLVANTDITVCVVDGNQQANLVQLKAGESQSVFGAAPWQVSSSKLAKLQIYFQGWRVALPEGADQRIALIEKTN